MGEAMNLLNITTDIQRNFILWYEAMKPAVERAAFAFRELGNQLYNLVVRYYLQHHKKLPGSQKTKRMRKKQRTIVITWFNQNIEKWKNIQL